MTHPPTTSADRKFSLLYLILVAGVATSIVVLAIVRSAVPFRPIPDLVPVLRMVAMIALVGAYVVMRVFRADIVPLAAGDDRSSWWRQHGTKALIIWVLAEGVALIGMVFWYVTGDLALLGVVAGVALVLLIMNRPARLMRQ